MNTLRYLTIDLFLYDLHSEVRESNLYKTIKLLEIGHLSKFPEPEYGYLYPVKLAEDSIALQISYSGFKDDWGNLASLDKIQEFKKIILEKEKLFSNRGGRNWFISAQLIQDDQSPNVTARKICKALNLSDDLDWSQNQNEGTFKSVNLFEFEQPDTVIDGINQTQHVIICLFSPIASRAEIETIIGQLYQDFLDLFLYRNNTLWMYEQVRQIKHFFTNAENIIQLIDKSSQSSRDLNALQSILSDLLPLSYKYEYDLGCLQKKLLAIDTNTRNYKKKVKTLKQSDPNADLAFLDRFSTYATEVYLTQTKSEIEFLAAGLKPLETFIKTIQGITEIENTKNDRTFNQTIAIATVGVSTAALAASTLSEQADVIVKDILDVQPNQPTTPLNAWLNAGLPFGLSIVIGALFSIATWAWLNRRVKQHR